MRRAWLWVALACATTSTVVAAPPPAAAAADPVAVLKALTEAVDLPTPKARAAAAAALAARPDVTIAEWLTAARAFAPLASPETTRGSAIRVDLPVIDAVEPTEIAIHVPTKRPEGPSPLLLAFHGSGSQGSEMTGLWRGVSDETGMLVVAPTEAGPNEGYRFSARERAAAAAALRWARRHFDVDEDRVVATGSSRGGHLTWDLASRRPDQFAAIAPMIGGPRITTVAGANNLRYVENLVAVPIRDLQGAKDDPHLVANVRLAFEKLAAFKAKDAVYLEFAERGHDYDFDAVDWKAFFEGVRRQPLAARVLRRASSPDEGRAAWCEVLALDTTVGEDVRPIEPPGWSTMSDDRKRRFIADAAEKRTARIVVERKAPGRFEASSTGVTRFRLLLDESSFEAGKPVTVTWNGRVVARGVAPSKVVLLREFVERFDRRFLPVAEMIVP